MYTSSESVVIGYSHIPGGDETLPYPEPGELLAGEYAKTKQTAERMLLKADGTHTHSGGLSTTDQGARGQICLHAGM